MATSPVCLCPSSTFRLPLRLFNIEQTALVELVKLWRVQGQVTPSGSNFAGYANLKLGFDIFRRLDDGSPLWVAQVDSIAEARARLEALLQFSPGHYFVRDAETGQYIAPDGCQNPREGLEQA
jgi:hypothetical protein